MEVIATGRPRGGSSQLTIFSVRDHELRSMKNKRTLSAEESTKLAGSSGWPVEALLETIAQSMDVQLDPASVGVFTASDGVQSEPISLADLVHGAQTQALYPVLFVRPLPTSTGIPVPQVLYCTRGPMGTR